jgi:hypothetical protein
LLGIHCGQFWDKVEVYKKPPDSELDGDPIHEGDRLNIQSGMTIVAPAAAVTELLNLREFEMIRQKRDNKRAEKEPNEPRGEAAPDDGEENLQHLEDFRRLVDAAARKRPQGDQT